MAMIYAINVYSRNYNFWVPVSGYGYGFRRPDSTKKVRIRNTGVNVFSRTKMLYTV
jgi:hypothetical protein